MEEEETDHKEIWIMMLTGVYYKLRNSRFLGVFVSPLLLRDLWSSFLGRFRVDCFAQIYFVLVTVTSM